MLYVSAYFFQSANQRIQILIFVFFFVSEIYIVFSFRDIVIYTFVIIDPMRCNLILNQSLEMANIKEAKKILTQYFSHYAANSCLDTLSFVLLFSLGNLSNSGEVKNFSRFICILLVSNFFIFITIYPALLSLVLQVSLYVIIF